MAERPGSRRSILGIFDCWSAGLYRLVSRSWLGRCLTGYRREPTALLSGETRARGMHAMSDRRCRVVRAAEGSRVLAVARRLIHLLADCPARLYGLFFLLYGIVCCLIRLLQPFLIAGRSLDLHGIVFSGILALVALPFALTRRSLAGAVGSGKVGYALTCRLLGMPEDRVADPCIETPIALFYVAAALGGGAAAATVWIHPMIIPVGFLTLGLLCMVLSRPETGVALSALMLPAVWIWERALHVLAALILLTWVGYGFKLLLMHRSFRLGRLDAAMLLFGILLAGGGLFGVRFSGAGLRQGLLMAALLSEYFLIVNLMNSRAALRRCMGGVGATLVLIVLLSCVRLLPAEFSGWLDEYRLGAVLTDGMRTAAGFLNALWSASFEQFLVLALPWLFVFLLSRRRLLTAVPCIGLAVLCGWLIWQTHSLLGIGAALLGCLLFALLYGHTSLTVMLSLFPLALTGGLWYTYFHPVSELVAQLDRAVRAGTGRHIRLWPGVFRMIADYPTGVGLGDAAFRAVYPQYAEPGAATAESASSLYLDLLTTLGIPGLAVALAALWLFCSKSFTCLRRCRDRWDRTVIIAGLCTVLNFMLLGVLRSVGMSPQLFFCLILVMGICSSLASVCAEEQEVLAAERRGETPEREDCFLWVNT